jgi:hypothetical protein
MKHVDVIERLQRIRQFYRDTIEDYTAVEAVDMAIEAVEKQEADRWHSVAKEGNPKESGLYIVTDNSKMDGNNPHTRYFNAYGDASFWSGWKADEVIAWKEIISEPYTEEES